MLVPGVVAAALAEAGILGAGPALAVVHAVIVPAMLAVMAWRYEHYDEPGAAGWPEHGCAGCSFMADHVPSLAHLDARDTTLAYAAARARVS